MATKREFKDFDDKDLVRLLRQSISEQANVVRRLAFWIEGEESRLYDEIKREIDEENRIQREAFEDSEVDEYPLEPNEVEAQEAQVEEHIWGEVARRGVSIRFLCHAAFLASWTVYESTVQTLALRLAHVREVGLTPRRVTGPVLDRLRSYFEEVLRFQMHPAETTNWPLLEAYAALRNALAHGGGYLGHLPAETVHRLVRQFDIAGIKLPIVHLEGTAGLEALLQMPPDLDMNEMGKWLENFPETGWQSETISLDHSFVAQGDAFLGALANELIDRFARLRDVDGQSRT